MKLERVLAAADGTGDVGELQVGGRTLVLKRPADVRHVLLANQAVYEKTPRLIDARARRILGHGLFTASNAEFTPMRRSVQGVLRRTAVDGRGDVVAACAVEALERWEGRQVVELAGELWRLERRIRARLLFGDDVTDALEGMLNLRRRRFARGMSAPVLLPARLPLAVRPSARRALRDGDRELTRLIERRRAEPRDDLLSALLQTGIPEDRVRAEVAMVAAAGPESLTRAQAWTLWALAEHPEVAAGVQREVDRVLGRRLPGGPDRERLPFTEAVVSESMRVRPPSPLLVRVASAADSLPTGSRVGRGDKVLICPAILHRDPSSFSDPERFDPGRFSPGARESHDPFEYLPFGAGPRACLGRNLAQMETVLMTAIVSQRFRLEPAGPGPGRDPEAPPAPMEPVHVRVAAR